MNTYKELRRFIEKELNTQWSRGNRFKPTPHPEDVDRVVESVVNIIQPTSYVRWNNIILDDEQFGWLQRIKKFYKNGNVSYEEFYRIINQPDFSIEGYEISKGISIETEKQMDKELLKKKFEEFKDE
jgi:hypothetical protein|tara:strand:- start:1519 stop:1899 length:381 start_codon:yes stop_codon:yes gene_type:complete